MKRQGYNLNHKTIYKIMKKLGIKCETKVVKYHSYKGMVGKVAPNLLKQNFQASKPNEKWVTNVSQFNALGNKLYLSPIIYLYNGEVISYNISINPTFDQIVDMLKKAFKKIPKTTNIILHSNQGWQYQMKKYQEILNKKGIRQSMSRKGNCFDNSLAENFFSLIKTEMFYRKKYKNIKELEKDIIEYIDYYNKRRIKEKLK